MAEGCPDELNPSTWRTLQALRAGVPLSRNRHFYLYEDPRTRRALKLHRYLRSLARDVLDADQLSVSAAAGGGGGHLALRLEMPLVRGARVAYLSAFEMELLAEQAPSVARLLAERAGEGATA